MILIKLLKNSQTNIKEVTNFTSISILYIQINKTSKNYFSSP